MIRLGINVGNVMYIYRCEDTQESIFTAIYNVYEDRRAGADVRLELTDEPFLFGENIIVEADGIKAKKVADTIMRRFGEEDSYRIACGLAADDTRKAQAIYRTVALGLKENVRPRHLFDNLADDEVHLAFSLAKNVEREYGHLRQFLRFEELEHGALYARFASKCSVLPFLMEHFSDRLPIENFVIYDEGRKSMGVHKAGDPRWYLMKCDEKLGEPIRHEELKYSENEEEYQALFKWFCQKIAIKERRNLSLQRNMLPLRFRGYMTEFK